ncbi:hypothetical protein CIHG_02127 [Coccidioides immitis H538.4]|uniref:Transmembrane protein n=1 Tax=Coccidioides immitis H538.4 TaxID=396776 RepID=A0A0J8RI76_COCIT|nr:hypothetical protein CIHG_02127 [Coccidioides immitis H538.4]
MYKRRNESLIKACVKTSETHLRTLPRNLNIRAPPIDGWTSHGGWRSWFRSIGVLFLATVVLGPYRVFLRDAALARLVRFDLIGWPHYRRQTPGAASSSRMPMREPSSYGREEYFPSREPCRAEYGPGINNRPPLYTQKTRQTRYRLTWFLPYP